MPDVERTRIEIAFDGGQIMGTVVSGKSVDALELALEKGTATTVVLDSDEGPLTVVIARVVYLKRFSREARIGFVSP